MPLSPQSRSGRTRWRGWLLVLAAVAVAGGAVGWRKVVVRRLPQRVAARLSSATGLAVSIGTVKLEEGGKVALRNVQLADPGGWEASLPEVAVTLTSSRPRQWRSLSLEHVAALTVTGGELTLLKPWRQQSRLVRAQERGRIEWLPLTVTGLTVRDASATETETETFLTLTRLALTEGEEGRIRLEAQGQWRREWQSPFECQVQMTDTGSDCRGELRLGQLTAPSVLGKGTAEVTAAVTCPALLAEEPRLSVTADLKLHQVTGSPSGLQALGPVTGGLEFEGVVVAAETPRLAGTVAFRGLTPSVPAVKVSAYCQSQPRKSVGEVVLHNAQLETLVQTVGSEATWPFQGGRGRVEAAFRTAGDADLSTAFEGTCRFQHVSLRLGEAKLDNLAGSATFAGAGESDAIALTEVTTRLESRRSQFASLSAAWRGQPQPLTQVTFGGLSIGTAVAAAGLKGQAPTVTGTVSGTARWPGPLGKPDLSSLHGRCRVTGAATQLPGWGRLEELTGQLNFRGARATLQGGKARWGSSWLKVGGNFRLHPKAAVDLSVTCEDLKPADIRRFLGARAKLPDYKRPVLRADLRLRGAPNALRGQGTVSGFSLPVNQRLLGDTLTASFTVQWLPSPLTRPTFRLSQQKVRLNLALPDWRQVWGGLFGGG